MLEIYYKEHLGLIDSFVIHLEFFKCEGFKTCVQYEIKVIFFLLLPLLKGGQEEAMTKFSIVPKKKPTNCHGRQEILPPFQIISHFQKS